MNELKKAIEAVIKSEDRLLLADSQKYTIDTLDAIEHLREVYEPIKNRL